MIIKLCITHKNNILYSHYIYKINYIFIIQIFVKMKKLNWHSLLSEEKKSFYFKKIFTTLHDKNKKGIIIYPKKKDIFNAFRVTTFESTKVVIIGQDPYHGPNQAHGLAFSTPPKTLPLPPSLNNIYTELTSDIPDIVTPKHGCLLSWATEGVLLLNSILTVEQGKSRSHANIGWEKFTDKIIQILNIYKKNIVFLLWGRYAQNKGNFINDKKHHILTTSHPSPMSAQYGFMGCRHFSKTNRFLIQKNIQPVNWHININ